MYNRYTAKLIHTTKLSRYGTMFLTYTVIHGVHRAKWMYNNRVLHWYTYTRIHKGYTGIDKGYTGIDKGYTGIDKGYRLHRHIQVLQAHTGIHRHTEVYTDIHRYTQAYRGIHRHTQVYTGIHRQRGRKVLKCGGAKPSGGVELPQGDMGAL
jgi:hypothetical protein